MKATELLALEPLGELVRFSDGTPRPPARFKKKLASWLSSNSEGYFSELRGGDSPYFTLTRHPTDASPITVEYVFTPTSRHEFEVIG
jgi:hypothetical protein